MSIINIASAEVMLFQSLFQRRAIEIDASVKSKTLDLGCGQVPRNPFKCNTTVGCDINSAHPLVVECDLFREKLPFETGDFSAITAFDFVEHVPRVSIGETTRLPFVELMNEISRVLRTGGYFYSRTPAYPHAEAFQDPTHVNIITDKTWPTYFCGDNPVGALYGFNGGFKLVFQGWHGFYLLAILQKT